ncbi:MAG TPA: hypothetical protein DD435_09230 [Cyanobacteria bacterium UBA8530]|nr:hypothetical protein [Cyanobacteria bacterium UBA8530]
MGNVIAIGQFKTDLGSRIENFFSSKSRTLGSGSAKTMRAYRQDLRVKDVNARIAGENLSNI